MVAPGTFCETGAILGGMKHPESEKDKFLHSPFTGCGWVAPSPFAGTSLGGQSHQHSFFTTPKTQTVHPASLRPHSRTTEPCSTMQAASTTPTNWRQSAYIFKSDQLLRPPGKERYRERPCCWAGGGLRSTGGWEATVPTEHQLCLHCLKTH